MSSNRAKCGSCRCDRSVRTFRLAGHHVLMVAGGGSAQTQLRVPEGSGVPVQREGRRRSFQRRTDGGGRLYLQDHRRRREPVHFEGVRQTGRARETQAGRDQSRRPPQAAPSAAPIRPAESVPAFRAAGRPAGTTIGRQGNLIIEGNLTAVPFLLGYAEMLFIEPFPKEAKAAWDTQTGLGVIERNQSSWHHIGPFSQTEVAHGATERIDFRVLETKPDSVRIGKNYALHTAPDATGQCRSTCRETANSSSTGKRARSRRRR